MPSIFDILHQPRQPYGPFGSPLLDKGIAQNWWSGPQGYQGPPQFNMPGWMLNRQPIPTPVNMGEEMQTGPSQPSEPSVVSGDGTGSNLEDPEGMSETTDPAFSGTATPGEAWGAVKEHGPALALAGLMGPTSLAMSAFSHAFGVPGPLAALSEAMGGQGGIGSDFGDMTGVTPNEDETSGLEGEGGGWGDVGDMADAEDDSDQSGLEGDEGDDGGDDGGDGSVICNELYRMGHMPEHIWRADQDFALTVPADVVMGYHFWAKPAVRWMRRSGFAVWLARTIALPWAEHMAYCMGATERDNRIGGIIMALGWPVCRAIGALRRRWAILPA